MLFDTLEAQASVTKPAKNENQDDTSQLRSELITGLAGKDKALYEQMLPDQKKKYVDLLVKAKQSEQTVAILKLQAQAIAGKAGLEGKKDERKRRGIMLDIFLKLEETNPEVKRLHEKALKEKIPVNRRYLFPEFWQGQERPSIKRDAKELQVM